MATPSFLDPYVETLSQASVLNPRYEAARIARHVLGLTDETQPLPSNIVLDAAARDSIAALVARRAERIPLERLLGYAMFEGVTIAVVDGIFKPYPETGIMTEHAVVALEQREGPQRVLDLGTGTGCILLALLRALPQASGVGLDTDAACIALAQKNAIANGLQDRASFKRGSWTEGSEEKFDLVIGNMPRVPTADIPRLLPEMRNHDPHYALDGGPDGFDVFRFMAQHLPDFVKTGGQGIFQLGWRQAQDVQRLFLNAGFSPVAIKLTYNAQPCCVQITNSR